MYLVFFLIFHPLPKPILFPYTTLFRSFFSVRMIVPVFCFLFMNLTTTVWSTRFGIYLFFQRSEEHTSELQSRENLVCRLLLEKKKRNKDKMNSDFNNFCNTVNMNNIRI